MSPVERVAAIIKDWVAKNYGESEANDPSWNIDELAWVVYQALDQ